MQGLESKEVRYGIYPVLGMLLALLGAGYFCMGGCVRYMVESRNMGSELEKKAFVAGATFVTLEYMEAMKHGKPKNTNELISERAWRRYQEARRKK